MSIPLSEVKRLYAVSGNRCAHPGCDQLLCEPGDAGEPSLSTGEIAHIIAESIQGPRGRAPLSERDRNRAENLVLLCERHHKIVDARPHIYTVDVLREMKRRHEAAYLAGPKFSDTLFDARAPEHDDTLLSSLLVVTELPARVYSATSHVSRAADVVQAIRWTAARGSHVAFLTRENRIWTFHNLRRRDGPFTAVIDSGTVEVAGATELWADPDGHRWYVELLNRALSSHLRRSGLGFDSRHRRYFFLPSEDGTDRTIRYTAKAGRQSTRAVVKEVRRRSGESRGFVRHDAVAFRFDQVADRSWALTIRPEFHLTRDGRDPLDGPLIGRRVTRLKSRIYNAQYLDRIQFWRSFLTADKPRLILPVGGQRVIIDGGFVTCDVRWPGVPDDTVPVHSEPIGDDLLSLLDMEADDGWGDEDDLEAWEDAEDDVT